MAKRKLRKGWRLTPRGCAAYSKGEKGRTVTVEERKPGGVLQARAYDPTLRDGRGDYRRVSLGYRLADTFDESGVEVTGWERAEEYADGQKKKLRQGLDDIKSGRMTIRRLFNLHKQRRDRSDLDRKLDDRMYELWQNVLGADLDPHAICEDDMDQFEADRLSGAIDPRGNVVPVDNRKPVRQRSAQADIEWLRSVLRWAAYRRKDQSGRRYLLREHPLRGYVARKEKNPLQPVATEDRFTTIMTVVDQAHRYLGNILTIKADHGRRIGATLALTYADVSMEKSEDYPYGYVEWPGETDKKGKQWKCPMTPEMHAMFKRVFAERPGIGSTPIFPSPRDRRRPYSYKTACRWLRKAEELVGLEPLKGGRWHPYRRKWASERKHLPDVDVARAGGWSDLKALKNAYQHDDPDTTLSVLLDKRELRRVN